MSSTPFPLDLSATAPGVHDTLLAGILTGQLPNGYEMPSYNELKALTPAAKSTIQKAVNSLTAAGYLIPTTSGTRQVATANTLSSTDIANLRHFIETQYQSGLCLDGLLAVVRKIWSEAEQFAAVQHQQVVTAHPATENAPPPEPDMLFLTTGVSSSEVLRMASAADSTQQPDQDQEFY